MMEEEKQEQQLPNEVEEIINALAGFESVKHMLAEQLAIIDFKLNTNQVRGKGLKERIESYFGDPNWNKMSFTLIVKEYVETLGQRELLQDQLDDAQERAHKIITDNSKILIEKNARLIKEIEQVRNAIKEFQKEEPIKKDYVKTMQRANQNAKKDQEMIWKEESHKQNYNLLLKDDKTIYITQEKLAKEFEETKEISKETIFNFILEKARVEQPIKTRDLEKYNVNCGRVSEIINDFVYREFIVLLKEDDEGRTFTLK